MTCPRPHQKSLQTQKGNSKSPASYPSAVRALFPKLPSSSSLLHQHPGKAGRSCCNVTSYRTRPLRIGSAMWNNCLLLMLCALSPPEHNIRSLGFRFPAELVKQEENNSLRSFSNTSSHQSRAIRKVLCIFDLISISLWLS